MSLSCSVWAFTSVGKDFCWVCPSVPMRPQRTVKPVPWRSIAQNFCDEPSVNSKRRRPVSAKGASPYRTCSRGAQCFQVPHQFGEEDGVELVQGADALFTPGIGFTDHQVPEDLLG